MSDESHSQTKRMFFGLEVDSPWPKKLPKGRMLDEAHRHLTLAFLGNVPYGPLQVLLPSLPIPSFGIGPVGQFDQILFLPLRRPNVIAWRVDWFRGGPLLAYQRALVEYLRQQGYRLDEREFFSHVTLARWPFDRHAWERLPFALPVVGRAIHLYESMGSMRYMPIWTLPLMPSFEVLSHTADIAFFIRGDSLKRLFLHAQVALAFEFPPFLRYIDQSEPDTLDDVIGRLNRQIGTADGDMGVPFKAVSYHGTLRNEGSYLAWEMIVDV